MNYLHPDKDKQLICSMCNRVVLKLLPMYDDDGKHEKTLACFDCKKKVKQNLPIKRYER